MSTLSNKSSTIISESIRQLTFMNTIYTSSLLHSIESRTSFNITN
nr:MAG TPA: hypothetical protein [Caudoviricetes sp.]